jgi:ribonuclease VapC
MVIDSSALVSILLNELGAEHYEGAIAQDQNLLMSVASVLETAIVMETRFGDSGGRELDLLIHRLPIRAIAVDRDQLEWARIGFRTYGKGRHPAGLNFGDCFSYALSKASGEPLLFKGSDFERTDVLKVL